MDIKIMPPLEISGSDWQLSTWYELEIYQLTFNTDIKLQEYNIKDKNTYLVAGYSHSVSAINLLGVITENSDIPGSTLEEKKENLIEAASAWWTFGDQQIKTNCSRIDWRGWDQYMMIERLDIEKSAGEDNEYPYEMKIIIHEGAI